jgi:dipeptidyl aminopeptidase/acylaminoacyl peptidase
MLWVRERHEDQIKTQNEIVLLPSDGSSPPRLLVSGHDFFSNPRFNSDGTVISWLCWDHPSMPWDSTELWTASIDIQKGEIGASEKIAGGEGISIFQPEWGPDDLIYFISDESSWWNIYRQNPDGSAVNISPLEAEFGYPQWLFGFTKYTFMSDNQILASYKVRGQAKLGLVDTVAKSVTPIDAPFNSFENPSMRSNGEGTAWFFAGAPDVAPTLCSFDLTTGVTVKVLELGPLEIKKSYVAEPEQIKFQNRRGSDSYAFFYSPTNPMYSSPHGELPPLIVMSHGGPTSSARPHLDLETQFWTSRGYAVVDVDYSGSVGYGRAYRERLNEQMGIVDVEDCVDAALYLAVESKADPERLIIRGGSAGGYVTLSALTLHDVFSVGCSYYGIADLESLALHSHKFEAHYLDTLIGPYPEEKEKFEQRSPINHIDQLKCPMILFQGLEDQVVPPEQSVRMKEALDAKGLAYAYVTFQHEGHGFDDAESILRALQAEQYFYTRIFDIPRRTGIVPLQIQNLDPP